MGADHYALSGDQVVVTPAVASCELPTAAAPGGVFRDRTSELCARVTEQRLAIGGGVLIVTSITALVLLASSRRRRPAIDVSEKSGALATSGRAAAIGARVELVIGLITVALGGGTLLLLGSHEARLHVDLRPALAPSVTVQTLGSLGLVGPPLGNEQEVPWREEIFLAVQKVPADPRSDRDAVEGYLRGLGASVAPTGSEFDDGWVDERGSIGADFVEFGPLSRFVATGAPGLSDYEDAAHLLTARLGPVPQSVVVVRFYPDPRASAGR